MPPFSSDIRPKGKILSKRQLEALVERYYPVLVDLTNLIVFITLPTKDRKERPTLIVISEFTNKLRLQLGEKKGVKRPSLQQANSDMVTLFFHIMWANQAVTFTADWKSKMPEVEQHSSMVERFQEAYSTLYDMIQRNELPSKTQAWWDAARKYGR